MWKPGKSQELEYTIVFITFELIQMLLLNLTLTYQHTIPHKHGYLIEVVSPAAFISVSEERSMVCLLFYEALVWKPEAAVTTLFLECLCVFLCFDRNWTGGCWFWARNRWGI